MKQKILLPIGISVLVLSIYLVSFLSRMGGIPNTGVSPDEPTSATPPTSLSLVDDIISELSWGNAVFNAPTIIQLEEPGLVELYLSPTKTVQQLQAELNRQENIDSARVQISNRMKAMLSGRNFDIQALVPEEQALSSERTALWQWEAVPTKEGDQKLHLSLSAVVSLDEQSTPIVIQTFSKYIEVKVSTGQRIGLLFGFLASNWEWLWAAVLVPIATFLWRRHRKKQVRKPNRQIQQKKVVSSSSKRNNSDR